MTASAVGSTSAAPPAPRSTPASGAPDPGALGRFDHQLHAARQRNAPRDPEPSPTRSQAHDSGARPHPLNNPRAGVSQTDPHAASTPTPPDAPATTADTSTSGSEATTTVAPGVKAPDTAAVDDQGAAALAGAMLALIGPALAGVLRPAAVTAAKAADVLVQAGKTVATDASAAMLLQLDDAASATAAAVNPAPATLAGMFAVADGLLPIGTTGKDHSATDVALSVALPAAPPAAAATPPVLQLPSTVGSPTFAQDLGQQVAWLGGQNIKQARIRLHPEELGSLDVKISVTHGRVDVVFSAQHPGAVAAVQQSLPQLDQMLAQHGLSLGHAEVGQHDRGDRHGHAADTGSAALDDPGEIHGLGMTTPLSQIGLLDAFA